MQKSYDSKAIESLDMDFISIECLEKLGLDQNPFIDHARDPFLFTDKQLDMSLNVLIDYLLNQNSTIVLLGEVGVGKTTHLRMLLRKGYQQFNFCTLRAKPKTTFAEIELKIKERWRLSLSDDDINQPDANNEKSSTTSEHIKKYIENNKQPVLIIDDAHRLHSNVLDELLKLKHHVGLQSSRSLGLVLASEPALQTQLSELEQTNAAATQVYQINIRSLDEQQCKEYLQFRIDKAGTSRDALIDDAITNEIFSQSKGLPKLINKLARENISKLCDEKVLPTETTEKIKSNPATRLAIILAGLVGLALLFTAISNKSDNPENNLPLDLVEQQEQEQEQTSVEVEDEVSETTTTEIPVIKKEVVKQESESSTNKKNSDISDKQKKEINKPYVAPLVLGPLQTKKPKSEAKKEKVDIENIKPKKIATLSTPHTSDWILKQDPKAYTIQIVASPNEKNLLDFAKRNSLNIDTAYYNKTTSNKSWFVLVHGIYSSREKAISGIEGLSESLKKNTPYPVQIKYLQEVINQ
jgi:type II secretory pathway predicted ATPase ExeA/septal ring-binding cell division protein DamX